MQISNLIGWWTWAFSMTPRLHGLLIRMLEQHLTSRRVYTMQSSFTCQRCLKKLRANFTGTSSPQWTHLASRRRWKSTAVNPSLRTSELRRPAIPSPFQPPSTTLALAKPRHGPSLVRTQAGLASAPSHERVLLQPDNLFHPFSVSPLPEIRKRAMFMKTHAYCPHPSHHQTRMPTSPNDPEARKVKGKSSLPPAHVRFECPDCGIPVSCSEDHWADDYETHMEICDQLREINEDDHDLRSGRVFPEFEYPPGQIEEILVNLTNWDTYLYTRNYNAINEARPMRQATRLLTYPVTIASVLHELSPYSMKKGGRLTMEGLKSLTGMCPCCGGKLSIDCEQHYDTLYTPQELAKVPT